MLAMRTHLSRLFITTIVGLLAAGCGGGAEKSVEEILDTSRKNMSDLESYHLEVDTVIRIPSTKTEAAQDQGVSRLVADVAAPNRLKATLSFVAPLASGQDEMAQIEIVTIGDTTYSTDPATGVWESRPSTEEDLVMSRLAAKAVESMTDATRLADEEVGGVLSYRLKGNVRPDVLGPTQDPGVEAASVETIVAEIWIGKDDLLVRRVTIDPDLQAAEVTGTALTLTLMLSRFNEAVIVVAPKVGATPIPGPTRPVSASDARGEVQAIVISSDLSVGPNRLVFSVLEKDSGPVKAESASIVFYYLGELTEAEVAGEPRQIGSARFRQWPLGDLGVYTAQVDLGRAGNWRLEAVVTPSGGETIRGRGGFVVKKEGSTPAIGSPAPRSKNKTGRDVDNLEELTTARPPDVDLYQMTIAEALDTGLPLVVTFATPIYCQTATCGPQVRVIEEVKDRYKDRANFIHVEIFDEPHLIQGDLASARTVATVEEWGLPSEPWTFVVNREGWIAAKFEAFTTAEEIEEQLERLVR